MFMALEHPVIDGGERPLYPAVVFKALRIYLHVFGDGGHARGNGDALFNAVPEVCEGADGDAGKHRGTERGVVFHRDSERYGEHVAEDLTPPPIMRYSLTAMSMRLTSSRQSRMEYATPSMTERLKWALVWCMPTPVKLARSLSS